MSRGLLLFAAWAVIGFFCSFSLLYGFTLLAVPIVLMAWAAYRFLPVLGGRRTPESLGALGGLGAFIGFLSSSVDSGGLTLGLVGALIMIAAGSSYFVLGRRRCESRTFAR